MGVWRDDIPATLYYSHTLTLAGHGTTWFRCEITWGGQKVRGENYKNLQNCYGATWSLFPYQKGQFIAEHIPIFSIFSKSAKLPVAKVMDD